MNRFLGGMTGPQYKVEALSEVKDEPLVNVKHYIHLDEYRKLKEENEKLKEILAKAAKSSHKCKELYEWYREFEKDRTSSTITK